MRCEDFSPMMVLRCRRKEDPLHLARTPKADFCVHARARVFTFVFFVYQRVAQGRASQSVSLCGRVPLKSRFQHEPASTEAHNCSWLGASSIGSQGKGNCHLAQSSSSIFMLVPKERPWLRAGNSNSHFLIEGLEKPPLETRRGPGIQSLLEDDCYEYEMAIQMFPE